MVMSEPLPNSAPNLTPNSISKLTLKLTSKSTLASQSIAEPSQSPYTSEIKLLLSCARTCLDPATIAAIQDLLDAPLDWAFVLETAIVHGVAGLLYQNLQRVGLTQVPEVIVQSLRLQVQQSTLRSMLLTQELLRLQPLFAAAAIPMLPFKGPLLSTALYQNLGLRQTSDLDLLVPPEYFQAAIQLLQRSGYQSKREWTFLNPRRETAYIDAWHEYSLTNGCICIDLHQALTPSYFLSREPSFDQLWQNRQMMPLTGQSVWSFGQEDLLIYLTVHGSKECWRALKWICDIAEFVRTYPDTNWSQVIVKAQDLGSERMLLIGFWLAHQLLGLAVPTEIQQRLAADERCLEIANQLARNLFTPDRQLSNKFSFKKTWLHFRMMQTGRDRLNCLSYLREPIRQAFSVLFPNDRDQAFFFLPPQLYFLYYLLRPFRLMMTRLTLIKQL